MTPRFPPTLTGKWRAMPIGTRRVAQPFVGVPLVGTERRFKYTAPDARSAANAVAF